MVSDSRGSSEDAGEIGDERSRGSAESLEPSGASLKGAKELRVFAGDPVTLPGLETRDARSRCDTDHAAQFRGVETRAESHESQSHSGQCDAFLRTRINSAAEWIVGHLET